MTDTATPGATPAPPPTAAPATAPTAPATAPAPSTTTARRPSVLRQVPFRRYWAGQTVSLFGDQITDLALPLLAVLVAHAGAAEMGYLTAAGLAPHLLFSLLAGAWADRRATKRRVMIAADLGRAAVLLAVPLLSLLHVLSLPALYLAAFGVGSLTVLFEVCRTTLFVSLVSTEDFLPANSWVNGSRAFAFLGGSSVGGFLVQVLTAPVALVADAASYLVSAVLLGRIHPVEPEPAPGAGLGLTEGLRFLVRSPVLRACLLASSTLNLFNYMYSALIILYVTTTLGISPLVLGLGLGLASVGALLGAAVARPLADRFGVGPILVLAYVLFPAPLVLIPFAHGAYATVLILLLVAEFCSGLGVMILDIVGGSLQTSVIPDQVRARVAGAFRTVNYGIRPVGALLGGAVGSWIGVRPTLMVATIGAVGGVLWLFLSPVPRIRTL